MDFGRRETSGRGTRFYTPLLPYLCALIASFFAAGIFENLREFAGACLSVAAALFVAESGAALLADCFEMPESRAAALRKIRFAARIVGVFALGVWYFYFRVPPNPYADLAPRRARVEAVIDEVSRGANDSRYGIATITNAPYFAPNAVGHKMWFTVSDGKNAATPNKNFIVSQKVSFDGVFSAVYPSEPKSRGFGANTPEGRAFEKYLRSRFVYFKMSARIADASVLEGESMRFGFYEAVRKYAEHSLSAFPRESQADGEAARTYRAMILGDKSLLTEAQKRDFRDTGTMHVFAISGLHVGFAAAVLYGALAAVGVGRRFQPFVALPALYLYVCACGARPSAMRAFGMVALVWLALAFSRGMRPFGALVLAAAIAVVAAPQTVFDAGFGLSYAIVASIFVYSVPLYGYLSGLGRSGVSDGKISAFGSFASWAKSYFLGAFCISLGAMFAAAPLGAHYFSYFSPMSVLYSPVFVGGAGLAVGLGFAGFALPNFIAGVLNTVAAWIVGAMSAWAKFCAEIWSGRVDFPMPNALTAYSAVAVFLVVSAYCADLKNAFLRFGLAPLLAASIMLLFENV